MFGVVYITAMEQQDPSRVFSGVRVAQSLDFCVAFCRSLFVFSGVRVAQSLDFCVVFCRSLFVFMYLFFCLSIHDC